MKKVFCFLVVLLLASCGSDKAPSLSADSSSEINAPVSNITIQSILSNMEKGRYKEGELLVKFKSGVLATSSLKTHQSIGATSLKKFSVVPNLEHVKLPEGLSVRDAITKYMNDPSVEYAEPNYIKRALVIPNDTHFSLQWALQNTGQSVKGINGTAGSDIHATAAWDITTGNAGVIVAVLDTGIDFSHPDFIHPDQSSNISNNGSNFVDTSKPPIDDNGHGTHVSGIIGAVGNNGIGIAGLMWSVQLMPLKFLDATGSGTIADEIAAIGFAVAHGAKIMNASFAGPDFSNPEYGAISSASNAGILLMAAAGNEDADNDSVPSYPASFSNPKDPKLVKFNLPALPNIISVTATDQSDSLSFFSNFGLNSVQVAAPGVNILSTIPLNLPPCTFHSFASNYDFCSGTSQATPHVSGLAGLLYSVYPNFTYSQIRGTILRYVDNLSTLNNKIQTGGRINAYKALSSLLTPTNLSAGPASSSQISLTWTDNATGEDGYKIERKSSGGDFIQIATTGPGSTSFTDSTLSEVTLYTFRVRAFNTIPADSSFSNEASATTPLNPPTNLTATAASTSQVNLVWTDNSQSEEGYKIERKGPADADFVQIAQAGPNIATFSDSGLNASTTYTYRVRAFNTVTGNSAYSGEASATTLSSTPSPPPPAQGGGGGGCSIGGRQHTLAAITDLTAILLPLILIFILRYRRRFEK